VLVFVEVEAHDSRVAGAGRQQRREHAHCGRLAGAVGSEECEDLALLYVQVDARDGFDLARELFAQSSRLDC
jgi:hypothetical protein